MDSNHRSNLQQIYSLSPLATRESAHIYNMKLYRADDRTRTDNLLITNQLLCQLSHIGIYLKEGPTKWGDSLRSIPVGGTHEVGGFLKTPFSCFKHMGPIGLEPMTLCL